ncbi:MAG: HAD family phosphatase [Lachnospiraceae bacterium]|nr:HAD family phosphatase [Lachnospiraceae bacterium]
MKYSTILWDMDGVLMDSEQQHWRAWERTFRELFGIDRIDWEVYKYTIGVRYEVVAALYEREYGVDVRPKEVQDRYDYHKAAVEEEEGYLVTPHLPEVLAELQKRGYRMAVASSSPLSDIERFAEKTGLSPYFELLFSGDHVKHSKPAPDTFLKAAECLQSRPECCVVIEDSYFGVKAAKAANMACIGFRNPGSGDQDLTLSDAVVDDLREVIRILDQGSI